MDWSRLPVNWIDGMKISRKHFEELEQFIHEQIRDTNAQQITDYNFGILPAERSLDLIVFCDFNQQISVELNACKAVTPNGSRIYINTPGFIKVNTNFKEIASRFGLQSSNSQNLYIVLSIDPFSRIPTGEPVMEEDPPRHPFTQGEIKLDVIPSGQINNALLSSSIIIGKISYSNGELIFQRDYIPSCTSVASLPIVLDWYNKFRQMLETWEKHAIKIVQKTNSKAYENITLINCVCGLAEKMLEKLSDQKLNYQWIIGKSAPIFLCEHLLRNVQHVVTILDCYEDKDRTELLNYFAQWMSVDPGTLENQMLRVLQIQYNHNNITGALKEIESVYNVLLMLFEKLTRIEPGKKGGKIDIFLEKHDMRQPDQRGYPEPKPPAQEKPPPDRWSPYSGR